MVNQKSLGSISSLILFLKKYVMSSTMLVVFTHKIKKTKAWGGDFPIYNV